MRTFCLKIYSHDERPSAENAFESVQFIITEVKFGWLIRSIHSWSANLMIATLFIHMFSVFFLRAYRRPREMMWLTGVGLLFVILGFAFTGHLLPWDTTGYFATLIGTEVPRSVPIVGETTIKILTREILSPLHFYEHPAILARFGLQALCPARIFAERRFTGMAARGLFAGVAALVIGAPRLLHIAARDRLADDL